MDIAMRLAVDDLTARYVHAIDDGRLEDWPELFVASGRYRITTAENFERGLPLSVVYADSRAMLRDRVTALRHANIYEPQRYRHLLSATRVERLDAERARAVSSFEVVRIMQSGESVLFATGRYLDVIRLDCGDGQPRFEERVVVCDSRRFETLLAIPL